MIKRFTATFIALLVFTVAFDLFLDHQLTQQQKNHQKVDVSLRMAALRARLEKEITQNLLLLQGMASFISVNPELTPDQFNRYAMAVLAQENLLKNLAAAPDFKIRFIYPLKGNEEIAGVDYRNLPDQWEQAKKVKENNTMVVAGPLELVQGGWGLIGRAPVFINDQDKKEFWGIVSAAIDVDRLFQIVEIHSFSDLDIAIQGVDGKGEGGDVFWGNPSLNDYGELTVRMPVIFPSGSWLMTAVPKKGWTSTHPFSSWLHVLLSLFFFTAVFFTYKNMRKNNEIDTTRKSLKQAQEIALSKEEKKIRAMLEATYDAYIMIDSTDRILFWSPAAENMFGWTSQEALGQKAHDLIVPPGYREEAAEGLKEFARTGQGKVLNSVMEFQVFRKNGDPFFIERTVAAFESDGEFFAVSTLRDISDRKKAENKLRSYAERISLASEAGGVGIWEWDIETGELVWNKQMYEIYCVSPDEFTGLYEAWTQRVHPDDLEGAEKELELAVNAASEWRWEFRIILPDKKIRYIQAAARTHRDSEGRSLRMIGINLDMTGIKEAQHELEKLATTDSLTGLANRGHFMKLAAAELEKSRRYSRPLSVMMLDADKFKNINDTYGHETGDRVLQALASSFKLVVRNVDIIGRIGGEEFGLILPETGVKKAAAVAERIRQTVEQQAVSISDNTRVKFTISIGVSSLTDKAVGIDVLLKRADEALYSAKASGRNRVVIMDAHPDT